MRELWIGVVEVLTEPSDAEENTRAFTNVIAWAESTQDYATTVKDVLESYGWAVLSTENVRPVSQDSDYCEEIAEIIGRARSIPEACILSTLHYYPSRPN